LSWTITFSESVSGLTAANLALTGSTGATITGVTGSGNDLDGDGQSRDGRRIGRTEHGQFDRSGEQRGTGSDERAVHDRGDVHDRAANRHGRSDECESDRDDEHEHAAER
jgi:hypothetical protein